ncbi:MAG: 2-dehydro-3-deoxyphosphooctonate aldolase [Flavobacterium sp.]|nr:2-dehydro-3-deoxyphosphooctonate aldolase [Flavobacterium sp.]
MKNRFYFAVIFIAITLTSCVSTRNTIKNIDNNAPDLVLNADGNFVITDYSKNPKYAYNKDYPVNLFYKSTKNDSINQPRFLNALAGPNGEKIAYKKLENCCPFPTKRNDIGVGMLDVYEITWSGQSKPLKIYVNIYEKGYVTVPMGLTLKK